MTFELRAIAIVILFAAAVGLVIVLLARLVTALVTPASSSQHRAAQRPRGRSMSSPPARPGGSHYDDFQRAVAEAGRQRSGAEAVDPTILALAAVDLPGTNKGCFLEVVGESFRQTTLARAVLASDVGEATFYLFPEIAHEEDPNAVAV